MHKKPENSKIKEIEYPMILCTTKSETSQVVLFYLENEIVSFFLTATAVFPPDSNR